MKKRWIVATILCLSLNTLAFSISDLETIRKRVLEEILVSSVDDAEVENVLNSMSEDGSWSSINYEDVSRTAFEHRTHLTNMLLMANAFNLKQSKFYRDKKLKKALATSLDFWVQNDFICENWWYNQIGVPTTLVNINMLMDKHLPEDLVAKTQPIIGRAHLNASGARPSGDRIKIAAILATNLLYNRKEDEFSEVMKVIEGEIKFSTGSRGMQQDYSFHHREDRVNNTLSYGTDYAYAFAKWATFVRGTGYAFSEEKINILVDYYLDGICKQMVFGKSPDPAAKNRSIARPNAIKPNDASMARKLISCTDYRKDELQENIDICTKDAKPTQSFAKFFWQAEHFSFQRPTYYTSVRMYSTRNYNMEWPYNGEGLLNHYRGDGVNHISITGMECADIWPVYDYQKIPGTTILQKPEMDSEDDVQKPGLTDFVGAVTDSMYAAVAFDFRSPHDDVKAKKSWFFFDDIYVCLGAGIS
ncbi:MAG: chondroitin lyase, partial [Thalassobius sp.]|nr:chondroitin lyase [Thalassovita sp.]